MSLIKSISGIRGTIGGAPGEGLSPLDIVKFTAAYATFLSRTTTRDSRTIVVGRDARLSGTMVNDIVVGTLTAMGFDVVNIGLASTPTTEIAVVAKKLAVVSYLQRAITPNNGMRSNCRMKMANSLTTHKVRKCFA